MQAVVRPRESLKMSRKASRNQRVASAAGRGFLFLVTSASALAVLTIFIFILKDALPFFSFARFCQFFGSTLWYPSGHPPAFGALAIFFGSLMVTVLATLFAVPLGVAAAVCLSDVLSFKWRQFAKPVIEMLAAIPSVAYGFFALVVLAPALQDHGGRLLAWAFWLIAGPLTLLGMVVLGDSSTARLAGRLRRPARIVATLLLTGGAAALLAYAGLRLHGLEISSGTNALNVSLILGIMALPTIVSVSEDALQAAGKDMRAASYALGATRSETILRVILPAASSGITAAVILGVMRAIGETMVVWMASGNAARIPHPWYNLLAPVRTLTATIAGDMGEADQLTGSARYHVLFAMALSLLVISFLCNILSEWAVARAKQRMR